MKKVNQITKRKNFNYNCSILPCYYISCCFYCHYMYYQKGGEGNLKESNISLPSKSKSNKKTENSKLKNTNVAEKSDVENKKRKENNKC